MSSFKAAAFDLDDTLLRDDLSVSDYTAGVFRRLTDTGFLLIPASGRAQLSMLPFVEQIRPVALYIACNGAEIWDGATDQLISRETFSMELGCEIAEFGKEFSCYAQTYEGDRLSIYRCSSESEAYVIEKEGTLVSLIIALSN